VHGLVVAVRSDLELAVGGRCHGITFFKSAEADDVAEGMGAVATGEAKVSVKEYIRQSGKSTGVDEKKQVKVAGYTNKVGGKYLGEDEKKQQRQGLTLVHYSAQLEPFLTQNHTLNIPTTPYHPLNTPETTLTAPHVTQKALKLS